MVPIVARRRSIGVSGAEGADESPPAKKSRSSEGQSPDSDDSEGEGISDGPNDAHRVSQTENEHSGEFPFKAPLPDSRVLRPRELPRTESAADAVVPSSGPSDDSESCEVSEQTATDSDYPSREKDGVSKRKKKRQRLKKKKKKKAVVEKTTDDGVVPRLHRCVQCVAVFDSMTLLKKHYQDAHPLQGNGCPVPTCSYRTATPIFMRRHLGRVHGPSAVPCTVPSCEGYFIKRCLRRHVKTHHKNEEAQLVALDAVQQQCPKCDFKSLSTTELNGHVLDCHVAGVECPVEECGRRIKGGSVDSHMAKAHPEVKYTYRPGKGIRIAVDSGGGTTSAVDSDADAALFAVSVKKKPGFQCENCEKSFNCVRNLRRHIASVHEQRYKKFERTQKHPCTFEGCSKSYRCQADLTDHLNKHNGVYPYTCDTCQDKFFSRARYAVHLSKYHNMSIKKVVPLPEDDQAVACETSK